MSDFDFIDFDYPSLNIEFDQERDWQETVRYSADKFPKVPSSAIRTIMRDNYTSNEDISRWLRRMM